VNESNLACSLFSGKQKTPARKKNPRENAKDSGGDPKNISKGFSQIPDVQVELETNGVDNLVENIGGAQKADVRKSIGNSIELQINHLEVEIIMLRSQILEKNQIATEFQSKLQTELSTQIEVIAELKRQNEELELRLNANLATSSLLQRSLQEISALQSQPSDRLIDLESQVAELQEQVLKQAGQAAEYEAAIQHWKEQSLHHQRHALQLSGALDRLMDERKNSKRSTKLEKELAKQTELELEDLTVIASIPELIEDPKIVGKVNLPSFLVRQRPALT
jgi:chromosome segregation ATPase